MRERLGGGKLHLGLGSGQGLRPVLLQRLECGFYQKPSEVEIEMRVRRSTPNLLLISAVPSSPSTHNLFFDWIPSQHASGTRGVDGHTASEDHAVAQFERTVRLIAGTDVVEEILHMGDIQMLLSVIDRLSQNLGLVRSIDLLWPVSDRK